MNAFWKRPIAALLLIVAVGVAAYANTFHAPFTFDDDLIIVGNTDIRSLEFLQGHPTRVVAYATFALNYHFGGLDVTGYHVVNLLIHLTAAILVYTLLRLTFRTPYFTKQGEAGFRSLRSQVQAQPQPASSTQPASSLIPLLAALLFVAHPIQTQAVTYIVQRMASLATLFYLLSIVLYVLARLRMERPAEGKLRNSQSQPESSPQPASEPASLWFLLPLAGSVLSALLAMFTKEIAFTLPLAIVLYEVCFFRCDWRRRLPCLLPLLATLPIVPLTVLGVGESAGDVLADASEKSGAAVGISRFDYLFTQFRVIVTYLRLLLLPVNQNVDYAYPLYTTFFTPPVFLSFLLLGAIFGLAIYLLWRTRPALFNPGDACVAPTESAPGAPSHGSRITDHGSRRNSSLLTPRSSRATAVVSPQPPASSPRSQSPSPRHPAPELRLIAFGLLWLFLALAVESSLIPITDVIFEHRLYLPMFGAATVFAAAFGLAGARLAGSSPGRWPLVVAALLVGVLAVATFQRNHVWGDSVRLWQDVVSKSPDKGRPLNNLAVALEAVGRRGEAIELLRRAIEVEPAYHRAWYNLGDLYLASGRPLDALPLLQRAIELKPDLTVAYVKYGAALLRARQYGAVVTFLSQHLDLIAESAEGRFYLGAAHVFIGNRQAAERELVVVSKLDPAMGATLAGLLGRNVQHRVNHDRE